jgi:hypothetical protein
VIIGPLFNPTTSVSSGSLMVNLGLFQHTSMTSDFERKADIPRV